MSSKSSFVKDLKNDVPASIVVFLVALPLCLGIALASGAPLFSGIIAGIVGGIVVASLSGSPLGVSGPAAGLAVIVLTAIQDLGGFEIFLLAVVVAGVFQLVLGFLKAGVIGYYFPSSVIKGMLSGIGIIIILKQIPHAFGYDNDPVGDFRFFQVDGENTFSEIFNMVNFLSPSAFIIAAVSMAILILWEQSFMKKQAVFKVVQGPLIAVLSGIGLNIFFQNTGFFPLQADQVVSIPVSDSLNGFIAQFSLPDFSHITNPAIYVTAITLAVVASLETLLCVEATDKLDPMKRVTPTNRELKAQGIGNILSGMIGGLPVTQVIVRSSANIQSGGKSKKSAIIHGFLLLGSAMAIPALINMIPLASLAAILIIVGYKLVKPSLFKSMYKMGKTQFIPFMATILGIVFTDLLIGIGIGLAVAIFHILYNNYLTPYHFEQDDYKEGDPIKIKLAEDVSFLNKGSILHTMNEIPDGAKVIIDSSESRSIHPDVIELIEDFKQNSKSRDITIEFIEKNGKDKKNPVTKFGEKVLSNGNGGDSSSKNKPNFSKTFFNF